MTRTIWHCHIAVSLDGKIARPDGSFDWLMDYPPQAFGIDAFLAEVDAIVMGVPPTRPCAASATGRIPTKPPSW